MAATNLPAIQHPLSRLGNPANINVRGVSRGGSRIGDDLDGSKVLRPITADQTPWRLTRANSTSKNPPDMGFSLGSLPEGVEVTRADPSKPAMPIFGNRADLTSRAESRASRVNTAGSGGISADELEVILKEKTKTSYFPIKNLFKQYDPEGKGIVNRESLALILSTFLAKRISMSQFNRLMVKLHLDHKKMIAFDEFYACFRPPKKEDEGPAWLELSQRQVEYMNSAQVHAHLKEKVKQKFLDIADLMPQMNAGGSGRILKPEFRNMMNKLGFFMTDEEFDKLWQKYDADNIGTVNSNVLMNKLGVAITDSDSDKLPRSPRKLERERQRSLDVERWLKRKFREGFSEMKHAFQEVDVDKTGRVNKHDFRKVLQDFGLKLDSDAQLEDFLARCGVEAVSGRIPYKEFLRRFQDRSENGMPHKILANPLHRYHQSDVGSKYSTSSGVEGKLMELFQKDFLSLLGTFHNIDRRDTGLLTQQQFRAGIEGRFELSMNEDEFEQFLRSSVPLDADGMVKYVEFMSRFDTEEKASLFADTKSTIADFSHTRQILESPPPSPRKEQRRRPPSTPYDENEGRDVPTLKRQIKDILVKNSRKVEAEFHELDELNTKRMSKDMLWKLLRRFGYDLSKNELKRLWDTFITDQKGYVEFWQFIRHFVYSIESAAFPNAKISPPKRGDNDFMMRSNKLNSSVDMLYDQLHSKIDFNLPQIMMKLEKLDPAQTGLVSREDFADLIQDLCLEIGDTECKMLCDKFDPEGKGGSKVSYYAFVDPFLRKRSSNRHGHNMMAVMTHPNNATMTPPKTAAGVTSKIRSKLHGDLKELRRGFKKVDTSNSGNLTHPEFKSVLRMCDINLDEEEWFQLFSEYDQNAEGKVLYKDFLDRLAGK